MKTKYKMLLALMVVITGIMGCYKDILSPGQDPSAPPQAVSFSGDLVPLFVANCSAAGCHDAAAAHKPSLTALNAYNAILNGGFINTVVPTDSKIYGAVKSGTMPPTGALKPSDVQKILDWVRNGAPNN